MPRIAHATLTVQKVPVSLHWEPSPHCSGTFLATSPAGRLMVRKTGLRGENKWVGKVNGRVVGRWFSRIAAQNGVEFITTCGGPPPEDFGWTLPAMLAHARKDGACRLWPSRKIKGRTVAGREVQVYPHRLAWALAHDCEPGSRVVRQTCGRLHCIEPAHLVAEQRNEGED